MEQNRDRILRRISYYLNGSSSRSLEYRLHKVKNVIPNLRIALAAIDDGTYGICIECGEKISRKRLESIPGAIRCVDCQSGYEKK